MTRECFVKRKKHHLNKILNQIGENYSNVYINMFLGGYVFHAGQESKES